MGFLDSIQSIISVYLLIAAGYILTKKDILSTEFGSRIAWLVVNLTFPAYILSALPYQFTKAQFMESAGGIFAALIATAVLYYILLNLETESHTLFYSPLKLSQIDSSVLQSSSFSVSSLDP